ncbi:NAD-glutamate dehydrogenase [Spongisporangium articulatum]|uniref:NAD-glutamate dehydrogenase n=1 Tax=Spongisporangium articulatum TaxID=3362603 RepID=A0ABW8AK01_9ACTN
MRDGRWNAVVSGGALIVPTAEGQREAVLRQAAQAVEARAGEVAEAGRPPGLLKALTERYFRFVAADDLIEHHVDDLAGLLLSHYRTAKLREQGTTVVRVFTPSRDEDGWSTGHTVVEIVAEDMPFLVDSVLGELNRLDVGIHLLVHPQIGVRRSVDGRLTEVLDTPEHVLVRDAVPRDGVVESWIHLEIDRQGGPERLREIRGRLQGVLDDVAGAVQDWPRMVRVGEELVEELTEIAHGEVVVPGLDLSEVREAIELLTWLADGHFTFLGYREYRLQGEPGEEELIGVTGTGLGILRYDQPRRSASFGRLTPEARAAARDPHVLVLTKANSRATVHRTAYLDYIGVKQFDPAGNVVGERRFLGLFSSSAYSESVLRVPVVRQKAEAVLSWAAFPSDSYSGKELLSVLETYPRDELFEIDSDDLYQIAVAVMQLQERRRTRLFLRTDVYGRYVSCLVYLAREVFTTRVLETVKRILTEAIGGTSDDVTVLVSDSVLARLHLVVRMPVGQPLPELDPTVIEAQVAQVTRSWEEDFGEAALDTLGEEQAAHLVREWAGAFGESYREDFSGWTGVGDICRLQELESSGEPDRARAVGVKLYEPEPKAGVDDDSPAAVRQRLTLYRLEPLSLSSVLPFLANLGVEVVDERPYRLESASGRVAYLYDFGLRPESGRRPRDYGEQTRVRFVRAFEAAWHGEAESDGFDRLVLAAGLGWQQIAVLRAYGRYLRQAGTAFGQDYIAECLVANSAVASLLVRLFEARFHPKSYGDNPMGMDARLAACGALLSKIEAELDGVASLDHDRILRAFMSLVQATQRTNYFVNAGRIPDAARPCLAFKLDPALVPDLPAPRPAHEIFVYSPAVEGVHLRFGPVARGGLRWSDRREDFRTEVLGLVKAQMVKNAVIVPTGAKGGFFAKRLPDPSVDREAWLAEGVACYRTFISGLLDLTDNLDLTAQPDGEQVDGPDSGVVVPPEDVVRYDADDTYLVVAADKGTAAFSDIANEVANSYGFWLGDAFASGGSVGYDHKAMGITARGAWESVKRHFRELGHDVQAQPTTVVGIGDMSGDVFGNGMLLSESLQLVAAFDHRHIFLDPDPDPATSHAERRRLFELPRSSWADYDTALISAGGGVHPRTAKAVEITPQVAARLGLPSSSTRLTPAELIRAVLQAPVDLLWNGGIGTYVKAGTETHAQVGDRANDAIRVDGAQLKARVVGEGGNLGLTQLGRVEAALAGVRVNTDAIDNSAGVDCSDHEVNIKILLDRAVSSGALARAARDELLHEMTDEVGDLVLRDNYEQNVLLGNARRQAVNMLGVHRRFMAWLEEHGKLDRALEFLPDDETLDARAATGEGLTSPEFSVLVAYSKLTLTAQLEVTSLPDDPWVSRLMRQYFPVPLVERFGDRLPEHPLRRQIVTTVLVNEMVNRGGITFAFRAQEETSASAEQIARAYVVAREIFDLRGFIAAVEQLDGLLTTDYQARLYLGFRRLLDRAVRWLLQTRTEQIDVAAEITRFAPVVAELAPRLPDLVVGEQRDTMTQEIERLVSHGVPEALARQASGLLTRFMLLDIATIARATGEEPAEVAAVYLALTERLQAVPLLRRITTLPRRDRWQMQARASLRYDVYAAMESITTGVLRATAGVTGAGARIQDYENRNPTAFTRAGEMIEEVLRMPSADIAALSVVLRTLRAIARPVL